MGEGLIRLSNMNLSRLALGILCTAVTMVGAAEPAGPLDFTLKGNDGSDYPLAQHRGEVVLIVNVASKCGFTPQYKALQALYTQHHAAGLTIIGVPANDFRGQEPGTDAQIATFCSTTYGVTFPLMAKVAVTGDSIAPLYAWLTTKSPFPGPIGWNFNKFLVGRDGQVVARFESKVKPDAPEFIAAIEKALAISVK